MWAVLLGSDTRLGDQFEKSYMNSLYRTRDARWNQVTTSAENVTSQLHAAYLDQVVVVIFR